jgi:peroxiredoxin Q/BCP
MDAGSVRGGIPYAGRGLRWVVVLLLSGLAACGAQQRPDGATGVLAIGAAAPDLEGVDIAGKRFRLSDARSHSDPSDIANKAKPSVVYFYPKDGTPGCTKEACAFRDTWSRFSERGVVVFGVSRDSEASHADFLKQHELPFPLVADESGAIQAAYGVPSRLGMAARVTFLVDQTGRIAHVWPDVDPGVHADEVLKAIGELERTNTR